MQIDHRFVHQQLQAHDIMLELVAKLWWRIIANAMIVAPPLLVLFKFHFSLFYFCLSPANQYQFRYEIYDAFGLFGFLELSGRVIWVFGIKILFSFEIF